MKERIILIIVLIYIPVYLVYSQENYTHADSIFGDNYKTVVIGNQTWMAKNLNYKTGNSWCYDNNSSNCNRYGRLYDWSTAREACPPGWRLPSKNDFETLIRNVGDSGSNTYHALKEGGSSDFNALFGGWCNSDGGFGSFGSHGYWWSSSWYGASSAWSLGLSSSYQNAGMSSHNEGLGFSVRCIKK